MEKIRAFIERHEVLTFWSSIAVILLILLPIVGVENMWGNLISFYNGDNAGEKFISVWITSFVLMSVAIVRYGNWKRESDIYNSVAALFLAYYMYHYTKDSMMAAATWDNWFTILSAKVKDVMDWLTSLLPDWFFADGWLYLWFIARKILKYAIILALLFIAPSAVLAIPLYVIYNIWHAPKDLPSTVFEMVGPLVLFPPYFYGVLWISYNSPFYERWYMRLGFLLIACLVAYMACYRHRCPECGGSSLEKLESSTNRDAAEYTYSTKTWKESESGLKWDERITDHYEQKIHHNTKYKCARCGHTWWESYITINRFDR